MIRFATAIVAVMFVSPMLRAEEAKPSQGPFAVVVGVGDFTDPAITGRPAAEADAKALYDLVTDGKFVGISADRVRLLTGTPDAKRNGTKATKENVLAAVKEAVSKTGKDDLLVLAFFGRGAPVGFDKFAYFTSDATVTDRQKTGLMGGDLSELMKDVKAQRLVGIMDLSFKGFDAGKETLAEPNVYSLLVAFSGAANDDKKKDKEEEDENLSNRDRVIMLSCLPGNTPIEKDGHGLFAENLVAGLKGAADTDGYEADGSVTVAELTKYLDKNVAEQARKLGKNTAEKEAIPVVAGTAQFVLSKNPEPAEAAAKRVKRLTTLAEQKTISTDLAAEGKKLLDRMPKLKAQQELRRKYQDLADDKLPAAEFTTARAALLESLKLPAADAARYAEVVHIGAETLALKYVKPITEGELVAGAIRSLYKRIGETLPAETDAKLKSPKTLTKDDQLAILKAVRLELGKREDLADGKDIDTTLAGLADTLEDPYTVYFDKETMRKMESQIRSQYSGIGIHIRRDLARDGLLVVSPIKGSPAYKAGLRAGDLITEVRREVDSDGQPLASEADKVISLRGMKVDDAIKVILGKPGIPVSVVVEREGEKEPKVLTLDRARVSLETVLGVKRNDKDDWNYFLDEEYKIGYVYLTQFGPKSAPELYQTVAKLTDAGMKGFVLDLRYNPGGELKAALDICDLFLPNGLLLSIRPRVGKEDKFYDRGREELNFNKSKFAMTVLINGGSASASEIVSAALQDYDRAAIVGERSYGKGSVQDVSPFDITGGVFKMTTARYFPPMNQNIDRRSTSGKPEDEWGVKPTKGFEVKLEPEERQQLGEFLVDKEHIKPKKPVDPTATAKPPFKDRQLEAALAHLKKEIQAKNPGGFKKSG